MSGCSQRADRKCRREAMSSLPVPRSPTTRTGLDSGAARETCSSIARKAGASPMIGCTGRSVLMGCISPKVGEKCQRVVKQANGHDDGLWQFCLFFNYLRQSGELARILQNPGRPEPK